MCVDLCLKVEILFKAGINTEELLENKEHVVNR